MKNQTFLAGALVLLTTFSLVDAATWYVATNGNDGAAGTDWTTAKQTIQAAIDVSAANDTVLVSNGLYNTGGLTNYPAGSSLSNRVVINKPITVRSVNGAAVTTIEGHWSPLIPNGDWSARCVYLTNGAALVGFTLYRGSTRSSSENYMGHGGGAWCQSTSAVISDCVFQYNVAARYGAGAYNGTLSNCTLIGNVSDAYGGGASGSTLNNCTLDRNSAENGGGAYDCILFDCTLTGNSAPDGGGGAAGSTPSNCTLYNCLLTTNWSDHGGGADASTLNNCTLIGNLADNGGGACDSVLNNCSLAGNVASNYGGGTYYSTLDHCTLTGNAATNVGGGTCEGSLSNSTLVGNSASTGGGSYSGVLYQCTFISNSASFGGGADRCHLHECMLFGNVADYGGGASRGILYNCLLTGNSAGVGGGVHQGILYHCSVVGNAAPFGGGTSYSTNYNSIVYSNTSSVPSRANYFGGSFAYCCTDPDPGGEGNSTADPQFVDSAAGNYRLITGSPCIDSGNNAYVQGTHDLDGYSRIVHSLVDKGAYEFQLPIHYVNLACTTPVAPYTNWVTAATNIQDAIDVAAEGETVLVSNGVYATGGRVVGIGTITNRVAITEAITVISVNGCEKTIIQGAGPMGENAVRCAYIGDNALLSGFTLTNGNTGTEGFTDRLGGGALCGSAGILSNCTLSGNSADDMGGGVYDGLLYNCTISGNAVSNMGGGASYSTLYDCMLESNSADSLGGGTYGGTLYHCTLTGNSASNFGGGAANGQLYHCTLSRNSSSYGGGAHNGTLYDCMLVSNSAYFGGGAFDSVLSNCTLAGNSADGGGGSYQSVLYNSLFFDNIVTNMGGGANGGSLYNCTLVSNSAYFGGGVCEASLFNCIVYFNAAAPPFGNWYGCGVTNCCTTPFHSGEGNITDDPQFMNVGEGNYRLMAGSPCIDKGTNAFVQGTNDLDNHSRIIHGLVDMGAYEFQGYWAWAGAITNGLTNSSDCATGDGYPNLLKYATGSDPTNSDDLARMSVGESNGFFSLFNRNTNAVDVTLVLEGAEAITNDATWVGIATNINGSWGGATNVVETDATNPVSVTVMDPDPAGEGAPYRFLRLRVRGP